jgi:hypothetical protein
MNCGTVLHDKAFQFSNGKIGDKLAIVLSEYGTNHLTVKTTTHQNLMNRRAGCQINDKPPNYFLPKNTCWFDFDTWVELDEVYELDNNILQVKKQDGTVIEHKGVLDVGLMKKILGCALESEDIEEIYLDVLYTAHKKL